MQVLQAEDFESVVGGSTCTDTFVGFYGGVGAVVGTAFSPAGTVIGGTFGAYTGSWVGNSLCSYFGL